MGLQDLLVKVERLELPAAAEQFVGCPQGRLRVGDSARDTRSAAACGTRRGRIGRGLGLNRK